MEKPFGFSDAVASDSIKKELTGQRNNLRDSIFKHII